MSFTNPDIEEIPILVSIYINNKKVHLQKIILLISLNLLALALPTYISKVYIRLPGLPKNIWLSQVT